MKFFVPVFIVLIINNLHGQLKIEKIEPPFWWTHMQKDTVQLMIYGDNLSGCSVKTNTDMIKIENVVSLSSPNYLFIDLVLDPKLENGRYIFQLVRGSEQKEFTYQFLPRSRSPQQLGGFNQGDIIYLITPDRFVNGDTTNDLVENYDQRFGRDDRLARHGGDIAGIISKLDYIKELGFSAIWINPLIENNMFISYHGYSTTDFYKIDPRFGTNHLYKKLVEEAHERKLKIIMDHVSNHIADNHPWMNDLPFSSWLHGDKENHLQAAHHKTIIPDSHGWSGEKEKLKKGWFMDFLPDLNQKDPYLAKYLIQNTIWWIEYNGIDGIREDTYPYVDDLFLSNWAKAIRQEYPDLNIVGEVWEGNPATLSYFQSKSPLRDDFDTYLPCVTDFNLTYAFGDYLSGQKDISVFYSVFEQDFLYSRPDNLLTFIDNHDVLRAAYLSNGINNKLKIALYILLTARGIPQIYYGTEIGIIGGEDHGDIRADFPGGFPGDTINSFSKEGRTIQQNELFNFLHSIIQLRNNEPALQFGQMIHFPVESNIYIYKRILSKDEIIIIINDNETTKTIDLSNYNIHYPYRRLNSDNNKLCYDKKIYMEPRDVKIIKTKL